MSLRTRQCPDCGGPMYKYARFCKDCKAKGERNAMFGRKQSDAARALISARATGKPRPKRRGELHPLWKGADTTKNTGRDRARRWNPPQPCQVCGATKSEIHHVDGNTLNNAPSNLMHLCRPHHRRIHPGNGKRPLRPPSELYVQMAADRITADAGFMANVEVREVAS